MIESRLLRWLRAPAVALALFPLWACANPPGVPMARRDDAAQVIERYRETMARRRSEAELESQRRPQPSLAELLKEGDRYRERGELVSALFSYLRAHQAGDATTEPRERIAFLHLRTDPGRAQAIFELLLAEAPTSTAQTGLALAHLAQGNDASARGALETAIALDPDAATPRCLLGVILDRLGEHGAAREQYEAAHQLRPGDYVILNNLGVSYLMSDEPERALEPLRKAIHLETRDPAPRNNLGIALARLGRYGEALDAFRAVANEAEAQNNLGWMYFLNGEYGQAVSRFERAIDAEGDQVLTVVRNLELALEAQRGAEPALD